MDSKDIIINSNKEENKNKQLSINNLSDKDFIKFVANDLEVTHQALDKTLSDLADLTSIVNQTKKQINILKNVMQSRIKNGQ